MNPALGVRASRALFLALAVLAGGPARAAGDLSAAEQALFVENHLARLRPPLTLRYAYRKTGSLEAAFVDKVDVLLRAQPDGTCCVASAQFLSGARQVRQPEVEGVQGNPAILYFLERDIHEMERLTQGKANYFRKRIRMAVFQGAQVRTVTLPFRGRPVAVREITIAPYRDDPNRARFDKLADKQYVFMLASDVPGGLYGIRTRIDGDSAAAAPLLEEEMLLEGAGPAPAARQPR